MLSRFTMGKKLAKSSTAETGFVITPVSHALKNVCWMIAKWENFLLVIGLITIRNRFTVRCFQNYDFQVIGKDGMKGKNPVIKITVWKNPECDLNKKCLSERTKEKDVVVVKKEAFWRFLRGLLDTIDGRPGCWVFDCLKDNSALRAKLASVNIVTSPLSKEKFVPSYCLSLSFSNKLIGCCNIYVFN